MPILNCRDPEEKFLFDFGAQILNPGSLDSKECILLVSPD